MTVLTKSVWSLCYGGTALIALISALELLGKQEKRFGSKVLRTVHRINGYLFTVLLFVISYYCLKMMRGAGAELSPRGALHGLLVIATFLFFGLKILILRGYRKYYAMVVPLGISLVFLTVASVATSAGYYFAVQWGRAQSSGLETQDTLVITGAKIFQEKCSDCHFVDRIDTKLGPSLKGLSKQNTLPSSRLPLTKANLQKILEEPFGTMPAFPELSEKDVEALLAYLRQI